MTKPKGNYYQHIDALRAIAVLVVIIFHIDHDYLPGGFVGVDIFFVISGYLISKQLFESIERQTFSLREFYVRRIKRILPAAFSVILITILLAQILFLPEDAIKTAQSGVWSAFSMSNFYFWKFLDTGYFASASYTTPLLHYWSLSVEEQFYLFFPLACLLLLPKLNRYSIVLILILLILGSATASQLLLLEHHSFIYYMLPSRAGELLVGVLLAALLHFEFIQKPKNSYFVFVLSIVVILCSCLLIKPSDIFPGWLYLVPTIGAALFIWSGFDNSLFNRSLLNSKVVLWLGKISYSAYLVHWPILAFLRYGYGDFNELENIVILLVILLTAYLNWRFVEEKFRHQKLNLGQLLFKYLAVPFAVIGVISYFIFSTNGYGVRINNDSYLTHLKNSQNKAVTTNKYEYICQFWLVEEKHLAKPECVIGNSKETSTLLWGDSNAAHFVGILGSLAKKQHWSFRNISHASCPPVFFNLRRYIGQNGYQNCYNSIQTVKSSLGHYSTIIVSAAFNTYTARDNSFLSSFKTTISELDSEGKKVIIIGKAPVFESFDRHCQAKSYYFPFRNCKTVSEHDKNLIANINRELSEFADSLERVHYIEFTQLICENGCSPYKDDQPIYYDQSHIEIMSSWALGTTYLKSYPAQAAMLEELMND